MVATFSTTAPSIGAVLSEVAALARDLEDSLVFYRNKQCADGIITMQQQTARFTEARDDDTRIDAAIWAREGYQLLSSGLPDTYTDTAPDERKTGWVTAAQISKLFGGEALWETRVRLTYASAAPDSGRHNPNPDYLRALIALTAMSQQKVADQIGIGHRLLKYYLTTPSQDKESRVAPYPVQYAIERLAASIACA